MEVDSDEEEVVEGSKDATVQVEDNPNKPTQKPRGPRKKKYLDVLKENTSPEAVFDEVMKQPVTIKF